MLRFCGYGGTATLSHLGTSYALALSRLAPHGISGVIMITFSRTMLVGGEFLDEQTLRIHGILEDNIYAMEIQMDVNLTDRTILALQGQMKRYTTPVCPQALGFLQRAVGISLREEGWISRINREVGQKGCQHFAEILIECGRCLDSALLSQTIREARKENPSVDSQTIARFWVEDHSEVQGSCVARPHKEARHAR